MPCKEFKYVYKPPKRRPRKDKSGRRDKQADIRIAAEVFERVEQIAAWEGRRPFEVVKAMFNLGLETYQTLLDQLGGVTLPDGLPAVPGVEVMLEAVGKAQIQRETLKRIQQQSAELVEEQRRERERVD